MYLELSLPEHLADHPAFSSDLLAATASHPATVTTEPGTGDDDDDNGSPGAAIFNIAILLLIPLGMYFLLIRPQRRRRAEAQQLQSSIGVGDEVITTSGVYGFVTAIEEETGIIWLEIDDDVQIRISRAAVSTKVSGTAAPAPSAAADESDDAVDAMDTGDEAPQKPAGGTPPAAKGKAARPSLKGGSKAAAEAEAESSEPGRE